MGRAEKGGGTEVISDNSIWGVLGTGACFCSDIYLAVYNEPIIVVDGNSNHHLFSINCKVTMETTVRLQLVLLYMCSSFETVLSHTRPYTSTPLGLSTLGNGV